MKKPVIYLLVALVIAISAAVVVFFLFKEPPIALPIEVDGYFGFINQKGKVVIEPKFTCLKEYDNGLFAVATMEQKSGSWSLNQCVNADWSLLDSTGKELLPSTYSYVGYRFVDDRLLVAKGGKYERCSGYEGESAWCINDATWGFIDHTGAESIPAIYNIARPFSDGLAAVNIGANGPVFDLQASNASGKWGYIDTSGQMIIPLKFRTVNDFKDGTAIVDWKFMIDKTGKVIWEKSDRYQCVDPFHDGLAAVYTACYEGQRFGPFGYINTNYEEVIPMSLYDGREFSEGKAVAAKAYQQYGYIDKTGSFVIEPRFEYAYSFKGGLAVVAKNRKYGLIDAQGREVCPPKYRWIRDFKNDTAIVTLDTTKGTWAGMIDRSCNVILEPKYDELGEFSEDLALAKTGGLYGFVDRTGEFVIQPKFQRAYDFKNGFAKVKIQDKTTYINKLGEVLY